MTGMRTVFRRGAGTAGALAILLVVAAHPVPARAQAVERVTRVRRILRSACGQLQGALAREGDRAAWLTRAATEVEEGASLWEALRSEFQEAGPGPYAGLTQWARSAGDIAAGIEDMLANTRAGEAAAARTACGQNCGRFTALNEGAGLELAPDALFRFRQAARPLGQFIASEDLESMRSVLPRLEELRSRAMEWPATSSVAPRERMANLEAFSAFVDGFAEALRAGRDVAGAYAAMMKALEQAYDTVL